ncbi:MAG: hypothetical protein QME88_06735 [Actinomycetota bacterium]|nr:hypothetical protein [Actinomycetota bacterium]
MKDSRMLVPDFWNGRGRYSKQAISRKPKNDTAFSLPEVERSAAEKR